VIVPVRSPFTGSGKLKLVSVFTASLTTSIDFAPASLRLPSHVTDTVFPNGDPPQPTSKAGRNNRAAWISFMVLSQLHCIRH